MRGSGLVVVMGLAHQVMLPLAAPPLALDAADEPAAPGELDEPDEPDEEPPLLHAAAVSATATQATATRADRRLPRSVGTIFIDA